MKRAIDCSLRIHDQHQQIGAKVSLLVSVVRCPIVHVPVHRVTMQLRHCVTGLHRDAMQYRLCRSLHHGGGIRRPWWLNPH